MGRIFDTFGGVHFDNEADVVNQPGDVSFVISSLLALQADPRSPLHGLIDARRIAVAGHSDGAETALAVADARRLRDRRVRAAVVMSGAELSGIGGYSFSGAMGCWACCKSTCSFFFKDLTMPFYGYNSPDAKVSEGVRDFFWLQGMMSSLPAAYFCIKAFSETDLTEDLKRIDVPTLILHGDDDQIVPIADSALLSAKIVKGAKLVVYEGAPHGMATTLKDRVNEELLAFIKG